jgi:RNA polymerase sigma factor (sigma-70 family)
VNVTSDLISKYEGLVRTTAARYVDHCEEDFDDICQLFRMKVWQALESFEETRARDRRTDKHGRTALDRYVFTCIVNQGKDLVKKMKRNWAYLEEMSLERVAPEEQAHPVQREMPMLPSTLTADERQIVTLLYLDFDNGEISALMNVQRQTIVRRVRQIRVKLADWEPLATTSRGLRSPQPALAA